MLVLCIISSYTWTGACRNLLIIVYLSKSVDLVLGEIPFHCDMAIIGEFIHIIVTVIIIIIIIIFDGVLMLLIFLGHKRS